ncbi:MAG: adenylate/guanylate cyclase domain-containing protein [Proteobacteria bacterium]|nr:adenylate/guanylate cyclase domain-containing protein [Pseudomonadota bacterium]MBI3499340.1 adenylate/guanylate cyclase domain-containing protein [Pseudomonadota bacterium]
MTETAVRMRSARPVPSAFARLIGWILGGRDAEHLPERVRRVIERQQQDSEILVAWALLVFVGFASALYIFSAPPTDAPMDIPIQPYPLALSIYAVFAAIRVWLAHTRRVPRWFLALAVVIDIGLLMTLIWLIHLHYHQPRAFYLKAPTIFHVFGFIALRALRFEVGFVVLAGAVAVSGWMVLLAYAAMDPVGMKVTHSFIEYMTSSHVLVGAEIEKMAAMVTVTAILALVVVRARRLLVRSVAEQTAAAELSRFFDPEVAAKIKGAAEMIRPGEGELRQAATLFIDLRGFTPLARTLEPDQLIALLGEYQTRLVPVIQRHGGSVDKFLGDGIMASFGAAVPSATHAADALRAIDALIAAADEWAADRRSRGLTAPSVGMAVAVGEVLFGAIGDATRLEYTVIGDPVNLAAKLEKHTKVEKVRALTTADALDLALAQGYRPPREKERRLGCRVAGVDHPVDLAALASA